MFEPMLASALNESCSAASARYARMVLVKSLMETTGGYRMGVPRAPLSQVVAEPASRYLEERGGQVRNGCRVERLEYDGDRVGRAVLESGESVEASAWVLAVPPWSLEKLGFPVQNPKLRWLPIISAHLFYGGQRPRFDRACAVNESFQWVFNKSADFDVPFTCVQAVASAAEGIGTCLKRN